ncbi:hypothetical protein SNEBB_008419 [Seison nebaliae]|nr:hypothetical protein SNEBB_008419 [Seison nebaliae]
MDNDILIRCDGFNESLNKNESYLCVIDMNERIIKMKLNMITDNISFPLSKSLPDLCIWKTWQEEEMILNIPMNGRKYIEVWSLKQFNRESRKIFLNETARIVHANNENHFIVVVSENGLLICESVRGERLFEMKTFATISSLQTKRVNESSTILCFGNQMGTLSIVSVEELVIEYQNVKERGVDLRSFKWRNILSKSLAHTSSIKQVRFIDSTNYLLSLGEDHSIICWEMIEREGKLKELTKLFLLTFNSRPSIFNYIFSPFKTDEIKILCGDVNGCMDIIQQKFQEGMTMVDGNKSSISIHKQAVNDIMIHEGIFNYDQTLIITSSMDGKICFSLINQLNQLTPLHHINISQQFNIRCFNIQMKLIGNIDLYHKPSTSLPTLTTNNDNDQLICTSKRLTNRHHVPPNELSCILFKYLPNDLKDDNKRYIPVTFVNNEKRVNKINLNDIFLSALDGKFDEEIPDENNLTNEFENWKKTNLSMEEHGKTRNESERKFKRSKSPRNCSLKKLKRT